MQPVIIFATKVHCDEMNEKEEDAGISPPDAHPRESSVGPWSDEENSEDSDEDLSQDSTVFTKDKKKKSCNECGRRFAKTCYLEVHRRSHLSMLK